MMRGYIFTESEREEVMRWLKIGKRNVSINNILSDADQNRQALLADIKLLIALLRKYDAGY